MPHKDNTDFDWAWGGETEHKSGADPVSLIAQWRKHPNLQGWMERLFEYKAQSLGYEGGANGFNCQPIRLNWQDLLDLESAVLENELPETSGFFFGESSPEDKADDLAFIKIAKEAMNQDMEIYYDSWW